MDWMSGGLNRCMVSFLADIQKLTGFEFWFTPYPKKSDSTPVISPPRYKMEIVTMPVISLLLLTLVPQIHFRIYLQTLRCLNIQQLARRHLLLGPSDASHNFLFVI